MGLLSKVSSSLFGGKGSGQVSPMDLSWMRDPSSVVKMRGDNAFQKWLGNIGAPSSVDAVRSGMNNQAQDAMINQIGMDTRQGVGNTVMDNYLRGLEGGGASSDIATNAVAQRVAQGDRAIADTRLQYGLADLDRLGQREAEMRAAYGQRYGDQQSADQAAMDRYMQGLSGNANIAAQNAQNRRKGLFTDLMTGFTTSFGSQLGSKAGG